MLGSEWFEGRKTLITGAASGIGRALALRLAARRCNLLLLDRNEEGLAEVKEQAKALGAQTVIVVCDLADPCQVDAAVDAMLERWGSVHLLINSAGILYFGPFDQMDAAGHDLDALLAVNLHAPLQLIRRCLPCMLERAPQRTHILNVASLTGLVPTKRLAIYGATKHALIGYSLALHDELRRSNVGVSVLCPSLVRTALIDHARRQQRVTATLRPPRWLERSADQVADDAIRAIVKRKRLVVPGMSAKIIWMLQRWLGGQLAGRLASNSMRLGRDSARIMRS